MALNQLTVFVENKQGAIVDITEALANKNVDLRALSIADTKDFGILRLIVNNNDIGEVPDIGEIMDKIKMTSIILAQNCIFLQTNRVVFLNL